MEGNFPNGVFTNEEHRKSCSANPGDAGHPFTFNQSQVRKSCQQERHLESGLWSYLVYGLPMGQLLLNKFQPCEDQGSA